MKDKFIMIRSDKVFKSNYKELCEFFGYTFSKRIISLIEKDIKYLNELKSNELTNKSL